MTIIIEGAGEVGSHLAKMLSNEANDITVIDCDAERLSRLSMTADIVTITGNLSSIKVLKEAGVGSADLFIAVNPAESQDVNIVSALLAKKLGCKKVCARINDEEYLSYDNKYLFTEMGIDLMFYPEKIAAGEITGLLRHTTSTESMDFARGRLQLAVFKLEDDSPVIDMKISEFAAVMAPALQFRVVAISRGNETIMPQFDTKFKYHDIVFIITTREGIGPMMDFLGKSNIEINNVMILGAGPIGEMVANAICKDVETVKVLDQDKRRCVELSEKTDSNVLVINGDGRDSDFLLEEGIKDFDAFVAVTGNDEANILACVVAKKFGVEKTIAEVENIEYIRLAEEMGVDAVINKKLITAGKIFKMTLSNKVRFIKYMSGTDAEILEYIVAPESAITHKTLKDTDFPHDAIIGGIIRGNESFIAVGDTKIEAYDRVVVFSLPNAVKDVDRLFR
ncbi:MAG: Trk system potassium transporter TrkA [Candidatus Cryptobacteroides sp.]|nr:Trk system potassium transporter TrkA [Bacteroidales bacterium]MDY3964001.1 Trk system potassium transporter TrkA [Candidatus Cryptobacteroides sp.]